MRFYLDKSGIFHKLLDNEKPQEGWVEIVNKYTRWKDPEGNIHQILSGATPGIGWVEFPVDENAIPDPNYVPPYGARRRKLYPNIDEQLDMLWHELDTYGTISTNGDWYNLIKNIKEEHPKNT